MNELHDRGVYEPATRTSIDRAVGVLIALRGYGPEQAFDELVAHSYRFDVSLVQSSRSIVAAARGLRDESGVGDSAMTFARAEWGGLLSDRKDVPALQDAPPIINVA